MATPGPARDQVLVHFYRAVVAHADVWRQRMDATTNWAAATSAIMITFSFGNPASPHFVLVLALAFDLVFLLMESRRYQMYDLWRQRFRMLNRYLIAPALRGEAETPEAAELSRQADADGLKALGNDLAHTLPPLSLTSALAYRVRRNYGYLLLVVVVAWGIKLDMHPAPALTWAEFIQRAAVGLVPGELVFATVGVMTVAVTVLALAAPSERMRDWQELPSPLMRIRSFGRAARPTGGVTE